MKFFTIGDIDIIDLDALVKLLPGGAPWNPWSMRGRYVSAMLRSWDNLERFEVTTPLRLAHFIAPTDRPGPRERFGLVHSRFYERAVVTLRGKATALWSRRPAETETSTVRGEISAR